MSKTTGNRVEPNEMRRFYESGDLTLEIEGVCFRVHAAKLCEKSEVFADMFGLQHIGSLDGHPGAETNGNIMLQDDPDEFTLLLDVLYHGIDQMPLTIKQRLQLTLLAHKYEIQSIMSPCQIYLRDFLPKSVTPRDFRYLRYYNDDPSITPKVIRVSTLLHMEELLPWALYFFAIQSDFDRDELSEADLTLRESYSSRLAQVREINVQSIRVWNRWITRFMKSYCLTEWWVEEDECWRRTELLEIEKSSFILAESLEDPLQAMYEALDFCSQDLCSLCADQLTRRANVLMAMVLEKIREDILED
ncbi:hypothetical protein BDV93DRAFT_521596 [Ceratobasidium sp. AG-I]|nr:hypothetical protein BDV93DRAFT_521596 [Ceratobasidium sp. AG-I]